MTQIKINAKLLETSILIGSGIYGQGKCISVVAVAYLMLKCMRYKPKIRIEEAIIPVADRNATLCFSKLHPAQIEKIQKRNVEFVDEVQPDDDIFHCWLEVDGLIVNANGGTATPLAEVAPVTAFAHDARVYYSRSLIMETQYLPLVKEACKDVKGAIMQCLDFYCNFNNLQDTGYTFDSVIIEEGALHLNLSGSINSLHLHTESDNLTPWPYDQVTYL